MNVHVKQIAAAAGAKDRLIRYERAELIAAADGFVARINSQLDLLNRIAATHKPEDNLNESIKDYIADYNVVLASCGKPEVLHVTACEKSAQQAVKDIIKNVCDIAAKAGVDTMEITKAQDLAGVKAKIVEIRDGIHKALLH